MSFEVDGYFVLLALLVPAILLYAFATLPRWYIRSISKYALWRLRDEVVDDQLAGRLPGDHPAVQELTARLEWALEEERSLDLLHLLVWTRARRRIPPETERKLPKVPDLKGLERRHADRVHGYRMRYNRVTISAVLFSSWFGVAVVVRSSLRLALKALRNRTRHVTIKTVAVQATDEVAVDTRIGRSAKQFVTDKGPEREAALV